MSKRIQASEEAIRRASRALERYLERLQRDQRPRRPPQFTPDQARVYQMVALFRAITPGATAPTPEWVTRLQARVAAAGNGPCWDKEGEGHDTHSRG